MLGVLLSWLNWLNWLRGAERLRQRGDQFFLSGDFYRAASEYEKARSILSASDYRRATIEALLRECASRLEAAAPERGQSTPARAHAARVGDLAGGSVEIGSTRNDHLAMETTDGERELPELDEFFELAIGDKSEGRRGLYLRQGREFRAGYVALVQGDASRSTDLLAKALSRSTAPFIVHLELGRALSLGAHFRESETHLEEALALRPSDVEARILISAVQIELGEHEKALRKLTELDKQGESGPEFTFLHGRALAGVGRLDDAMEAYRETVRMEPHFHEAFFEGGKILADRGDVEAAFSLLRRACELAPDEIPYNRALGRLVLDHELDAETGLSAADRLMVTDEERQWEYLSWVSDFYVRRGWKREARDPLRRAIALVPSENHREKLELEKKLAALES